ncbi:glycoside hydrolase family 104 protein [Pseudomonas sp. NPDC087358]|uniref:glycoside hydrolase family 24 protein n=1 Tax=Pseudomonas sp. NPDC087358 TaxID=3364439 RepID=UPI00384C067F
MARISEKTAGGRNVLAFLDMLAFSEGTATSRYTRDEGYDVIVGGIDSPNVFTGYGDHPGVLVTVNSKGLKSTAAGRYQLLQRWWMPYRKSLALKDFSPVSQDMVAIQQIRERGALPDIMVGHIATAIDKVSNIWASLPGAGYGQREHKLEDLLARYYAAGGILA